jgi:hypothetical protein
MLTILLSLGWNCSSYKSVSFKRPFPSLMRLAATKSKLLWYGLTLSCLAERDALDVEARPLLTHLFRGMPSCEKVFPVLVLVVTQLLRWNYW